MSTSLVIEASDAVCLQFIAEQGPPGPPGLSGAVHVHTQSSAAVEWLVNHNLGFKPAVMVTDNGGNELDAAVQHISINQARIYFVSTTAGFARFN